MGDRAGQLRISAPAWRRKLRSPGAALLGVVLTLCAAGGCTGPTGTSVVTTVTSGPTPVPATALTATDPTAAAPTATAPTATATAGPPSGSGASGAPSSDPEATGVVSVPVESPAAGTPSPVLTTGSPARDPSSSSPAPGPTSSPAPVDAPTGFRSTVGPVDAALATRMTPSWRPGCPVPLADLRYVTVTHRAPDGTDRTGELVVAASVADDVVTAFQDLYDAGFPITSMRLVDDFGGDDDASMAADNTSAFNCRPVTGGGGFSEHSYGTAVDINPVQNPYVRGDTVLPPAGHDFVGRPDAPGVIHPGDATVVAFAAIGWRWGGEWSRPTDYQHFSRSGR